MSPAFDGASRSVLSALAILEEVAAAGPGVTAADISRNLGLSRSTTYRLVNLLAQEEYLVRTADLGGFALGHKIDRFVGLAAAPTVPDKVREVMDQVRSSLRFGLHLFGYRNPGGTRARITLLDIDPDYPLNDPARLVRDHSASAVGRLLTEYTLGRRPEFATQVGEFVPGFGCLAVPVLASSVEDARSGGERSGGEPDLVAALVIAAPAHRIEAYADLVAVLDEPRRRLGQVLG